MTEDRDWFATIDGLRRRAEAAEARVAELTDVFRGLFFQSGPPHLVQAVVKLTIGEYDSSWLEAPLPEHIVAAAGEPEAATPPSGSQFPRPKMADIGTSDRPEAATP